MTLTNKQSTFLSIVAVAALLLVALLGGRFRVFSALFLPLCLWLSLRNEPDQKQVRPSIRFLGWIFVSIAVVAVIGSIINVLLGR